MTGASTTSVAQCIRQKLVAALSPDHLDIIDESARHRGHAGARPEGESHFCVTIVAPAFRGKTRVQRQRLVYKALEDELAGPIHALALNTFSPEEHPGD
jgi:BolA protein